MYRSHHRQARKWLLGAATSLTALAPIAAYAQEGTSSVPADPATEASAKSQGLGEIVVTATRRQESIQKVPISLQALSAEKLEQRQVQSFADYAALLPSVSFASLGPGRSDLYFRGISFDSEGAGDTSQLSVAGIYLDEIPLTTAGRMPEVHVYDMQRVEALSGPQGTLFGSSSLSGTLRLITNKPKLGKIEGGFDIEGNKYDKGGFGTVDEGFLNIPVTDNVAVRIVGFYDHQGGYIDNKPATHTYPIYGADSSSESGYSQTGSYTINNRNVAQNNFNTVDEYGGRISVLVQEGDWTFMPQYVYQYLDAKGSFNYDPKVGDLAVHDFSPTENRDAWMQAALTINGKVGDFDVVSSTGYFHRRIKNSNDYTYYTVAYDTPGNTSSIWFHNSDGSTINPTQEYHGDNTYNKFTQEVRISVPKSWPFSLTVGGFYQWQKKSINEDYSIAGISGSSDGQQSYLRRDAFYLTEVDRTYQDYALFAEGTYEVVHNLKVTGGVRLFRAKNKAIGFEGVASTAQDAGCAVPFTAPRLEACDNVSVAHPYSEGGETHKASVSYQIRPDKMVYFTYSTGFRPGGSNTIAPDHPYKADTLSNFEIGFKTGWGRHFRLNAAAYYEKWKGVQYFVVPVGYNGNGLTLNAGDARVYGIEADFDLRFGGFSLSGSGSYNDAKLATDFCALTSSGSTEQFSSCAGDADKTAAAKGTRLPRQPRFKGQIQARYEYKIGELGSFLQFAANHQSSSTSNLDTLKDTLLGDVPGFTSVDFSTGISKDKWSVQFYIDNIADKRGQLSRNTFCAIEVCSDSTRTYTIKPRIFGLKFSNRF
ncbi:TonB-dependent receptor [Novosphingobium nitrogenifigens DSM 19370]|uniref:TonB-dependent receptor n=1 Tax=Novosphingobium nitrogenifigens DSM 19370 TaxID=983920 RepID=F1Z7T5_9SPHN|nr:TonB-dependent receptor [Novosphingobium nitrogenifigens]EGD59290.1 TonB-dependent receptor [Novosphingobium nitrogenifigens DSM 19370]